MKKIVFVFCVLMLLLLTGCAQPVPLKISVPADERGSFPTTTQAFVTTFNATMAEAKAGQSIEDLQKSEAGSYDRYTYAFDQYNIIAFDCERGTDKISAVYLAYAKKGLEGGVPDSEDAGTAPFGTVLPVIIHIVSGKNAEDIGSILDALGITTVSSPQDGFKQEHRESDTYYSLSVENETIVFAVAGLHAKD